jgi:hypothetical protein
MDEQKHLRATAAGLSLQQYVAPLERRLHHEIGQFGSRQRALIVVSLAALICLLLGAGITYTALRYTLTGALAFLCGLMLHGMIALALSFYLDGKQERRPGLTTAGAAFYGVAAFVLLLIAMARTAHLMETHTLLAAASISVAIYLMEMLLATGAGYWLHLAAARRQAALRQMQHTHTLHDSLIASSDRGLWWRRYYADICRQCAESAAEEHAGHGDTLSVARAARQSHEAERRWVEHNAPVHLPHPEEAVTIRDLSPAASAMHNGRFYDTTAEDIAA